MPQIKEFRFIPSIEYMKKNPGLYHKASTLFGTGAQVRSALDHYRDSDPNHFKHGRFEVRDVDRMELAFGEVYTDKELKIDIPAETPLEIVVGDEEGLRILLVHLANLRHPDLRTRFKRGDLYSLQSSERRSLYVPEFAIDALCAKDRLFFEDIYKQKGRERSDALRTAGIIRGE
ncbi:MAG TPA: hypothetical protein VJB66_01800 [Candidatus Nanoarchaeia archaeon]|nr:hypothetical protein [Candidatus Nanoarchaeia archaeon]